MSDKAHTQTEAAIAALQRRLRALYAQADKKIQDDVAPLLEAIVLDKEDVTQRERLKYAEQHGLSEIVDVFTDQMLDANEQAIGGINRSLLRVYLLNFTAIALFFKRNAGADIVSPWKTQVTTDDLLNNMLSKFTRRAYNRNTQRQHVSGEILQALTSAVKQGKSIPAIAKIVQSVSNRSRNSAMTIAVTETFRITNTARMDAFERASSLGIKLKKVWNHSGAAKEPRHWHVGMSGEAVALDKPFSNGLMFPVDPYGPPEETINCHCYLTSEILN